MLSLPVIKLVTRHQLVNKALLSTAPAYRAARKDSALVAADSEPLDHRPELYAVESGSGD